MQVGISSCLSCLTCDSEFTLPQILPASLLGLPSSFLFPWRLLPLMHSDNPSPPTRGSLVSSSISLSPEFDRHELLIYEEVARMPPFRRKTLVLIGAQGVGRRSLKNKLILWDPDRYGTTVPCEWGPWSGRCEGGCVRGGAEGRGERSRKGAEQH